MTKIAQKNGSFVYLLVGLLSLLLASALAQQFAGVSAQWIIRLLSVFSLAVSVISVSHSRTLLNIGVVIVILSTATALASSFSNHSIFRIFQLSLMGLFFLGMAVTVLKEVLASNKINNNQIIGAVCVYLLVGVSWAVLYAFIILMDPSALSNIQGLGWPAQFSDLIYFSFVCLSTLGFGDISPVTPIARFAVYIEALVGQFYLAILVASLIGAKFSQSNK